MADRKLIEKVEALVAAPSVFSVLKEKGEGYLKAVGTAQEKEAAAALIAELEADVMSIDEVLVFFESPHGAEVLGKETAAQLAAHAKEIKAAGAKYCDCPACAPGKEILDQKEALLA